MEWVPVEDFELVHDAVILVTSFGQSSFAFVHNGMILESYRGMKMDGVTHCQNLPQPATR